MRHVPTEIFIFAWVALCFTVAAPGVLGDFMTDVVEGISPAQWKRQRWQVIRNMALLALGLQLVKVVIVGRFPVSGWGAFVGEQLGAALAYFLFGLLGFFVSRLVQRGRNPSAGLYTGSIMIVIFGILAFIAEMKH